ncbi:MAG: ATP-binding protein [Thermodesulfovibrio sp.]|nr:ATP-binding protein [Thermodesulfovibrio sp.]
MIRNTSKYEPVNATPVKSFFVSMLTRDISLEDAMLDLLDNCVDGILRKINKAAGEKPYKGFRAEIEFKKDSFTIHDNCGGIPWSLHEYAFRMGRANNRSDNVPGSVGIYGIGMKRAIFKMGKHCLISTQSGADNYEVEIDENWLTDENQWQIPVKPCKKTMKQDGTTVYISHLLDGVADQFSDRDSFSSAFIKKVETHYAFIIHKGFEVTVNGFKVIPKPIELHFDDSKNKKAIRPFIFRTEVEGVKVFLAVGFSRPLPTKEDVAVALEETRYSSDYAGWTVLCNDRAVLYCDKSELTGWGISGVPQYHTQFIAISGIVEFESSDASKLPTTTTKRGIDASSKLYAQVKDKMIEGMKIFISYTNAWKTREKDSKAQIKLAKTISITQLKREHPTVAFSRVTKMPGGEQYKPSLPQPPKTDDDTKRISFTKKIGEIKLVAEYLFEDVDENPNKVGEACFDELLEEARK